MQFTAYTNIISEVHKGIYTCKKASDGGLNAWLAFVAVTIICLLNPQSKAVAGEENMSALRLRPELRVLSAFALNYEDDAIPFDSNTDTFDWIRLRLIAEGRPAEWFSFEIHASQDMIMATNELARYLDIEEQYEGARIHVLFDRPCGMFLEEHIDASMLFFMQPLKMYRLADVRWRWEDKDHLRASLGLERLNLAFHTRVTDARIGRQVIDFGGEWLWSPLDIFEPFDPRQFDRDHRYGVDAVRLDFFLGHHIGLTLVGAGGYLEPNLENGKHSGLTWYGSAAIGRLEGRFESFSFAVQGGKVSAGYQAGGEISGRTGILELKAQASYFIAADQEILPDHASAVAGIGLQPMSNLRVTLEYRFNEAVDQEDIFSWIYGRICGFCLHRAEHMLGLHLDWQVSESFSATLLALAEIPDAGWLQPGLSYRASDNLELSVGAMLPLEGRPGISLIASHSSDPSSLLIHYLIPRSELGTYPSFFFLQLKLIG